MIPCSDRLGISGLSGIFAAAPAGIKPPRRRFPIIIYATASQIPDYLRPSLRERA